MAYVRFIAALGAATLCGCGQPDLLAPPLPGEGVQLKMVSRIAAGEEVEHCQFFQLPAEELRVARARTRFTPGSHHVLLYLTPYASIPTHNDRGEPVDTSGVFDCSSGATDGWRVRGLVGGSQNPDDDQGVVQFPDGVAMTLPPGAVVLMNAHYVNATAAALEPEIRLNLETVPVDRVREEGALLFFYNPFIGVEPGGASRATMSCAIRQPITLHNATSHMHRRGVGFRAVARLPDGSEEVLHQTDRWEDVPITGFDPGRALPAGSRIEYTCEYQNGEARAVWQGPRSTDEMCVFSAAYYPVRAADLTYCDGDPEWVGAGTASCMETLACLQAIDPSQGTLPGLTRCVLGAAPAASRPVSAVMRCILKNPDPINDCAAEIAACQSAG